MQGWLLNGQMYGRELRETTRARLMRAAKSAILEKPWRPLLSSSAAPRLFGLGGLGAATLNGALAMPDLLPCPAFSEPHDGYSARGEDGGIG